MFRKLAAIAAAVALTLTASGCVAQSKASEINIDEVYGQTLDTYECGDFLCGTILAPVDWNNISGEPIELSFTYKPIKGAKEFLFVNPGGPGASGVNWLTDNFDTIGTAALRKAYNIVAFDPRGTIGSSPVTCFDDAQKDEFLYTDTGFVAGSPEDQKVALESTKRFVKACKDNTGPILAHIDTVSAAKDLDLFRSLFKQDKLNYLGFSYGTFLGTTYAALFPDKVGRFVLDGAIDPSVSDEEMSYNQLVGFDKALRNYMADCIENVSDCPFSGTVEQGLKRISDYLDTVELNPITAQDGRKVGLAALSTGLYLTLYSEDYWEYLTQAFNDAFDYEDGTVFIQLADAYNERNEGGGYASNEFEAFIAISCLDDRSDASPAAMKAQNAKLLKASPTLGRFWQNGAMLCANWPYPQAERPASYAAEGAPTILVVGTTEDPATPYQEAVALAHKILANAILLTYKGEGHTAYGRNSECVNKVVDSFLIDGKLPASDPTC